MARKNFWLGFLLAALSALLLADIAADLHEPRWAEAEFWASSPVRSLRGDFVNVFMFTVTTMGNWEVLFGITLLIAMLPHPARTSRDKFFFVSISIVASLFSNFLKAWFGRPRPGAEYAPLVQEQLASFPSGHSLISLCVYGFLAYLLWRDGRKIYAAACVLLPALIGLSRIYLAAHYPGDVAGGFAAGWLLLFTAITAHSTIGLRPPDGCRSKSEPDARR